MSAISRNFIQQDSNGFFYYDKSEGTNRFVYLRSIDIARILSISRKGTALERPFVDSHNAFMLSADGDRNPDLAMYLHEKFHNATHDHLIVPTDLATADDNWSGLV